MILLGVNVDHAATVRQARYRDEPNAHGGYVEPDPAEIAWLSEEAGADGITMHVREDRRHVQTDDVTVPTKSIVLRNAKSNVLRNASSLTTFFPSGLPQAVVCTSHRGHVRTY